MSKGDYLEAVALLTLVLAPLVAAGDAAARRLLPSWTGTLHVLAAAVLSIALTMATLHVVGTVGAFERVAVVTALAVAGGAVWLVCRTGSASPSAATPPPPPAPVVGLIGVLASVIVIATVVAQWAGRAAQSLSIGMLDADTISNHMPIAARFVQEGSLTNLHLVAPEAPTTFQAGDVDMLHAVGILLFSGDLLSPLVNLGWLALAFLAAWCVGRPLGVGPSCVAGVAVVMSTSTMASTQAGSAMTDVAALALLLASLAVLVNGWPEPNAVLVAGLAAGVAIAVKLTPAAAIGILTIGLLIAGRHHPGRLWLRWLGALTMAGSFWLLKNLVLIGNPIPTLELGVGELRLPHPAILTIDRYGYSVVDYATSATVWRNWFLPGLEYAFGHGWPAIAGLTVAGALLALKRVRPVTDRVAGLAVIAAIVGYALTPTTALGDPDVPVLFARNLRYVTPGLVLGLVLLPRASVLLTGRRRHLVLGALGFTWVVAQLPADGEPPWVGGHRLATAGGALAVLAVAVVVAGARDRRRGLALAVGLAVAGLVVVVAGGWRVQASYAAGRYTNPGYALQSPVWAWAQPVRDKRIGFAGFFQHYPLYGADLSNHVQAVARETRHHGFTRLTTCASWRNAVNDGRYDYIVIAPAFVETPEPPEEAAWTGMDPAAQLVFLDGPTAVYAVTGLLDPTACR